jgi:hypothetical protein
MGYRIRLGKVNKQEAEKWRHKPLKELNDFYNEDRADSMYYPEYHTELYEIGKYVSYENGREPYYTKFEVYKEKESEFDILSKEGLGSIIEEYRKETEKYLKELLKSNDIEKYKEHIERKLTEWQGKFGLRPYYLDEQNTDGPIVASWYLEYAIFNLVHIYRFFDWENDYLIYSGW